MVSEVSPELIPWARTGLSALIQNHPEIYNIHRQVARHRCSRGNAADALRDDSRCDFSSVDGVRTICPRYFDHVRANSVTPASIYLGQSLNSLNTRNLCALVKDS